VTPFGTPPATPTTTPGPLAGDFFTLTPCRLADTRDQPDGDYAGPALSPGPDRIFVLIGQCNIPSDAKAVSVNVTVTRVETDGRLIIYPVGTSLPGVTTISYLAGHTRANNGIVTLGPSGDIAVHCDQPSGTVDLILDVNGYFE
jgi:hypothetical protein